MRKIIPIDRFFAEMTLSDEEKKRREDLANDLLILFLLLFYEIQADKLAENDIDIEYYKDMLYRQYCEDVEVYLVLVLTLLGRKTLSDDMKENIRQRVSDIVDTTIDNVMNGSPDMQEYVASEDRATLLACNESNYFWNDTDYHIAEYQGYRHKQWLTMKDEKVRMTHALVDGQTLDIDEYFKVGEAEMLYPMDMSRNAYEHPEETVSCRCSIAYLK